MRTLQLRRCLPAILALVLTAGPLRGQTIGASPGIGAYGPLDGMGPVRTIGQTFTAPNPYMIDFSFWLEPSTLQYKAYVYAWDAASKMIAGPALFTSDVLTGPSGAGMYIEVNVPTGLGLTSGSSYVAFFSTYGFTPVNLESDVEISYAYAGGEGVYLYNDNPLSYSWNSLGNYDLHFAANFAADAPVTVTPEPATALLLGSGLAALAAARRKRKQA